MVLLSGAGLTEASVPLVRNVRLALVRQPLVPEDVLGDGEVAVAVVEAVRVVGVDAGSHQLQPGHAQRHLAGRHLGVEDPGPDLRDARVCAGCVAPAGATLFEQGVDLLRHG